MTCNDNSKSEVIVCPKCQGSGKIYERINAYEDEETTCRACKGHRVLIKKITTEFLTVD